MFDIFLSDHTDHPLYMQLYMQLRDRIRSGAISGGSRMPSVRSLQQHLNVSKTPIETAYQMLIAEGYVVSKPRSGLYAVNSYETGASRQASDESRLESHLKHSEPALPSSGSVIDFKPSAVDEDAFPMRAWRKMLHGALDHSNGEINQYGDRQGEYSFRAVLADYLRNSRGVICTPEQIVVGCGITYSIGIFAKLFAGVRRVAFEEPGYAPVREQFESQGFQVLPIPVGDKGLSLDRLSGSEAQAVYVTPSHQFPAGSVTPFSEREYLLHWANSNGAYIIEDDYDGEYRYFGKPIPSLQSLDRQGRVIYIGTFSKAFTPALRMNYMVLPLEWLDKLRSIRSLLLSPSRIDQWAMQAFMEQGHWYRHIRKMRNVYRKKHDRLIELVNRHFADSVAITGHNAGLHIQLSIRTSRSARQLLELAALEGVRVYDFQSMWKNLDGEPPGSPSIYLGFGGIGEAAMEKGIFLLKKAWAGQLHS